MSFKDIIANDQAVFLNLDEFGETHTINGKQYNIVVDNDRLQDRSKVEYEGVIVGDYLYFAKASDFTKRPKPDEMQEFDKLPCTVFDVRHDMGMLEVILKKNVS